MLLSLILEINSKEFLPNKNNNLAERVKFELKDAHRLNITDIDFNPNKQYGIITSGEDCQ